MKSPMNQRPDDQARADTEEFIQHYARAEKVSRAAREKKAESQVTQAETAASE
jgi:myo-inositol-1-phosphate synthase